MILLLKRKRREALWKNISKFCSSYYITQIILTYHMHWIVFPSSADQVVNRVHNFVQIYILIRMHCSDNLGFGFKNRGPQFGLVTSQGS